MLLVKLVPEDGKGVQVLPKHCQLPPLIEGALHSPVGKRCVGIRGRIDLYLSGFAVGN